MKTRREVLGLFGKGITGIVLATLGSACSSHQRQQPIRGPGSDKIYLTADELVEAIKKEYGVCVGVADASGIGAAYWDSDVKPAITHAAQMDWLARCGKEGMNDVPFHRIWLSGRSYDKHGEDKGPAALVIEDNSTRPDLIKEIAERYGLVYTNKTNLYRGKPIE